jgi:hypothetical protein
MNGFVYAVGHARTRNQNSASVERTLQKARLIASGNLAKSTIHISISGWPFRKNRQLKRDVVQSYSSLATRNVHVKNLQVVFRECQGIKCTVVVAASNIAVNTKRLDWDEIRESFDRAYDTGDEHIPLGIYFEICAENRIGQVLNNISRKWGDIYGLNVNRVIRGEYIKTPAFLWRQGKRLPGQKVATLGFQGLLKLLELDPYDPVILYFLGQSLESNGRNRLAQVFYARALLWEIDPEYNKRCQQLINNDLFIDRSQALSGLEKKLHKRAIAVYGPEGPFDEGLANLVFLSSGTLPLIGSPDSSEVSWLPDDCSVNEFINNDSTSSAFAAVSKTFMRRGQWKYALPFAIQASRMDGRYIYLRKKILNFATQESRFN